MTIPATAIAEDRFTARPTPRVAERQRGAYGVVRDQAGKVLVVRADSGRCYLPGGRIEAGETPPEALAREIGEECGWSADVLEPVAEREQIIFGGAVTLSASYWTARLTRPLGCVGEHAVLWLDPAAAIRCLHRRSDREALRAASS